MIKALLPLVALIAVFVGLIAVEPPPTQEQLDGNARVNATVVQKEAGEFHHGRTEIRLLRQYSQRHRGESCFDETCENVFSWIRSRCLQ